MKRDACQKMDIMEFSKKLIKNVAIDRNKFFTFEKKGSFYVHSSITKEFTNRLGVSVNDIEYKNLFQIFPNNQALINNGYYNIAWNGQETAFQVENCLNSEYPIYVVLSPVFLNGKVVSVIGHGAPALYVPIKLKDTLKKAVGI